MLHSSGSWQQIQSQPCVTSPDTSAVRRIRLGRQTECVTLRLSPILVVSDQDGLPSVLLELNLSSLGR